MNNKIKETIKYIKNYLDVGCLLIFSHVKAFQFTCLSIDGTELLKLIAFCWIFLASFRLLACQVDSKLSHLTSFYTFLSTNFNIFNAKYHPLWTPKYHSKNFVFSKKHFSILSLFNTLKTLWADLIHI